MNHSSFLFIEILFYFVLALVLIYMFIRLVNKRHKKQCSEIWVPVTLGIAASIVMIILTVREISSTF